MDTINENIATDYITAHYKEINNEIRQLSIIKISQGFFRQS